MTNHAVTALVAITLSVGTMTVHKSGAGEPAVILIPGLASGAWVWDATVRDLASHHTVYAVTLAGFDGTPTAKGDLIGQADASLQQLIADEHLSRPVVVGHSLGGFLAIRFAEEHPGELGGVVAVDGDPIFPSEAQMTSSQRIASADGFAKALHSTSDAEFAAQQRAAVDAMVTDPATAALVAARSAKSDRDSVIEYTDELLRADLRPDLDKIDAPLLEIVPVPKPSDLPAQFPASMRSMTAAQLADAYAQFDRALFPGAKTLTISTLSDARHFAMLDQPDGFARILDGFIDAHH